MGVGVVFSLFRAAVAAGVTVFLLLMLSAQFPAKNAANEEERIFNADNASTFGEDPEPRRLVQLNELGSDDQGDFAQLSIDGEMRLLRAGDVFLPCVKLNSILRDAVLIDNCGSYALLGQNLERTGGRLTLTAVEEGGLHVAPPNIVDLRQNRDVSKLLGDYRERLFKRPLSLRGVVNIEIRVDPLGERKYYLSPGKDPALFTLLPLQAGDRVVAVNGFNLASSEALTDIYGALGDLNQLALTIARGDQRWVMLLRL